MNTNSETASQKIKAAFGGLFKNGTGQENRDHAAQMLSFRYLSEIERLMQESGMTKRQLAERMDTTPGYITQLFRGDRLLNFDMLARIEEALSVKFSADARQPAALPVEFDYNDASLPIKPARHVPAPLPLLRYGTNMERVYAQSDSLTDFLILAP